MNWHFCIISAEKRVLDLCRGSFDNGCRYGNGIGGGFGDGWSSSAGYGDGDGWGGGAAAGPGNGWGTAGNGRGDGGSSTKW